MPIVSSILTDNIQKNGERNIHEVHTDQLGRTYTRAYQAEPSENVNQNMADYALQLNLDISNSEISNNVSEVVDADI
jgi:hypothetical protein